MKRSLYILLLAALLPLSMVQAKEYKVSDVPMVHLMDRTRYVSNPDNILSQEAVAVMDSMLYALEEKTGIQAIVVALTGIEGGDCFDFAYRLGKENGVGEKGRDNGLVILLSTDERCVQFSTGYGLEGIMPDAICKRIQQKYMVEHLANDILFFAEQDLDMIGMGPWLPHPQTPLAILDFRENWPKYPMPISKKVRLRFAKVNSSNAISTNFKPSRNLWNITRT